MSVFDTYSEITAKSIITQLNKRHMDGFYAPTKADALKKALEIIQKGSTVSWGGSESIGEIGLTQALSNGDYNVLDRAKAPDRPAVEKIMHDALSADYYLMSTNALTLDGQLYNIDGNGNRVAALIYGPKNVIVIAGINKVVRDIEAAEARVRNYTTALNGIRLGCDTPCAKTGHCSDCLSEQSMCCQIVTTRCSRVPGRIKVIIVGETLGY